MYRVIDTDCIYNETTNTLFEKTNFVYPT